MNNNIQINGTQLFYHDDYKNSNLNEYYEYILLLLKDFLSKNNILYSFNFGCYGINCDINLDFQYEHTIIKHEDKLYCKIHRHEDLIKLSNVFEYCNANIHHVGQYSKYNDYSNIVKYIPPILFDISNDGIRNKDTIVVHTSSKRREEIIKEIKCDYFHNVCGSDVYNKNNIKNVLNGYKVLLNIHQVDNHLTLEELRVLPSLLTGILIISEDVPYKESIPFSKHIIWSDRDNIKETLDKVLQNYEEYREKYLHGLNETYNLLKSITEKNIHSVFHSFLKKI